MNVTSLSEELIRYGMTHKMEDLYITPIKDQWQLEFRQGNNRILFDTLKKDYAEKLIARFKYLGQMDVGEKRKVQLGAITYETSAGKQRLRLSVVGNYQGKESLVLRFLQPLAQVARFYFPEQLKLVSQMVHRRRLYLFSGPTGSGKTTLMYRLAKQNRGQVITIEDPVEIEEDTFLQLQTNDAIGLNYDTLIQLALRHRPDCLIIGEIRDSLTAKAAIRAALTGHKVFATVHAANLAETKSRLRDLLPVENELDYCLGGIVYQRLLTDKSGITAGLLAYQFEEELPLSSWQQNLAQLIEEGRIHEEIFQQER
ncbi:competence type IV pilus ATPase ComGA [Enterococcus dispar]|uniref:competence type IV pilus ATPase ComGA n=1 Tax=Enterococcus dispar TaxID=44009 RepID=UPI00189F4211|nr:competence type IV pilus ATPase ComGA [Enterococcus dispar]MCU7357625.1 competence type IV pilus ATPase ComGA [Enterococcus dispar]MDT2706368.1 competence type IV pilus ATPase ComGA [Enterococcus dispar]WCG34262.1 competence type IV pilus ATPase ComGA [Enterococcus dispar]